VDRIVELEVLDGFRIRVRFEDGTEGVVALADDLVGPVFEPLRDPEMFCKVTLDEFGVPSWPNGADLAPDAIYEQLKGSAEGENVQGTRRS
jgi:hypothetical protein